jgi:hypothetical protein
MERAVAACAVPIAEKRKRMEKIMEPRFAINQLQSDLEGSFCLRIAAMLQQWKGKQGDTHHKRRVTYPATARKTASLFRPAPSPN